MACRAALMAVLPPVGSAIALQPQTSSFRAFGADESFSMEGIMKPDAETECQDARVGSTCYDAVAWLRSEIFKKHPSWYPGYTSETSAEDVQDMLYGLGKASCPRPCFASAPRAPTAAELRQPKFDCRDTVQGDLCYEGLSWLRSVGFGLHPDWYPGLTANSSTPTIQSELHRTGRADCPRPCALTEQQEAAATAAEMSGAAPESVDDVAREKVEQATEKPEKPEEHAQDEGDDCMDAKPETQCYNDVAFGVAGGVKMHHALYDGLKESSSFKDIQEFLYLNNRSGCTKPCPGSHVPLDELAKNPEGLRTKKRVEDMSIEEMGKYLSGQWDGYVAKVFTTDNQGSSTFAKRVHDPTTTVVPEEAMPLPLVDNQAQARDEARAQAAAAEAVPDAAPGAAAAATAQDAAAPAAPAAAAPLRRRRAAPAAAAPEVRRPPLRAPAAAAPAAAAPDEAPSGPGSVREWLVVSTQKWLVFRLSRALLSSKFCVDRYAMAQGCRRGVVSGAASGALELGPVGRMRRPQRQRGSVPLAVCRRPPQEDDLQESDLAPSTDAAREVLACLRDMAREATAETFGDLRLQCEGVLAQKLPETGMQQAALKKESVRYFVWTQRHVEKLKAQARKEELAAMAKEEEAKAKEEEEEREKEEQRKQAEKMYVDEPMPDVGSDGLVMAPAGIDPKQLAGTEETKEEAEQRIRKQVLEELMPATTAAAHEETEEEMRRRIKAEVIRDLEMKANAAAAEGGK
ncbi:unnamed protein product [Prorocentrum cordatum]|uniref:Uncharacterized protein n=1 Tax=Prorocentrum cordatum TaxID=2364126 RepID=A0ABN9WEI0_9DINO|nr:unnamed protein product [Polarella glacialis]